MPRPIHFEIPADNPERAIGFYKGVFGWTFQKWDGPMPYWMVLTGENTPGFDGGIPSAAHPGQGPVNTVDVPSCDEFAKRVEKAGGRWSSQDGDPGIGWLAYCIRSGGEHLRDPAGGRQGGLRATLSLEKRNSITSPSWTTYSRPFGAGESPCSRAASIHSDADENRRSQTVSARMKPFSKSEWITPAASGALSPRWMVQARTSFSPGGEIALQPSRVISRLGETIQA
jgi:predicted enzyme related to lactoylglutathione lyase